MVYNYTQNKYIKYFVRIKIVFTFVYRLVHIQKTDKMAFI